ncbi:MAG TPA: Npt1/Npt2 family nucleotide transporter, partial [Chlamydiales bacterium]|nr:Npt1/Npt2 family nucleotide transporter [Chlamydiales bacterium]
VFLITLSIFILFFLCFSIGIYPLLPKGGESVWFAKLASMVFFVMAELWKISLLTILFWGFVNQYVPLETAKRFYAPLILGGSIGTIAAGPLVSLCTSDFFSRQTWSGSLIAMTITVAVMGVFTAWLFLSLWRMLSGTEKNQPEPPKQEKPLPIWEGFRICFRSRYLMLLAWVTIADYVAYALGEVVFLDVLRQKFPDPRSYADFMGKLSVWNGLLTAFSAVVITPYLLRRTRWVVASLVTPVCLLVTEGAFFFWVWTPSLATQVEMQVLFGTIFYCLVRAAKYTLFDTSKEISFLLLPPLEKMHGKLVVDGMCSRIGRGGGAMVSILLIQACGGVLASVPIVGAAAIVISASCVFATSRLGRLVEERTIKRVSTK